LVLSDLKSTETNLERADQVSNDQLPTRLLLPFTHGVDMEALDAAIQLAKACHTTLVAAAVLRVKAKRNRPEPRLEDIMQAQDFLEAARWKAARSGVDIERFEAVTADVVGSLDVLTKQLSCNGVALFVRGGKGVLLSNDEILACLGQVDCTGYLVHLPAQTIPLFDALRRWLFRCPSWLSTRLFSADSGLPIPPSLEISESMRRVMSGQEEGYGEDTTEDQRIHSNG
jgi:hypothetical protein